MGIVLYEGTVVDSAFDTLESQMREHFQAMLKEHGPQLFRVKTDAMWDTYLDAMTDASRSNNTCYACHGFVRKYGTLVVITEEGRTLSAVWPDRDDIPQEFAASVKALRHKVQSAPVQSLFVSNTAELGSAVAGGWTHFALTLPPELIHHDLITAPHKASAEAQSRFETLNRALAEFKLEYVNQALSILRADSLYRAEKVIGGVEFLHKLHTALAGVKNHEIKRNIIRKAAAMAPPGYCTPRSGMVGTLVEDIIAGLPFENVKAKFDAKMHPLKHQRPQTPPSEGNIKQAEEIIAKLGLEPSLQRRFAKLEDLKKLLWTPTPKKEPKSSGGVFAHLRAKTAPTPFMPTPPTTITWSKFARTVLPTAQAMELQIQYKMNFVAMITAVHAEAPPLFQWDHENDRNPLSLYVYNGGSDARQWGLTPNNWVPVTAITPLPHMQNQDPGPDHYQEAVILILEGAADTLGNNLALFPETLRSELHGIRKTIEEFSKSRAIEDQEDASACGLVIGAQNSPHVIRVTTDIGVGFYFIDRWD